MTDEQERLRNIIKRTTLIVRDMAVSKKWYEQVLGMSAWYDSEFILSGEQLAAGKEGDRTHLVILKCDDPTIGMIGLLQWIEPVMPAPEISYQVGYGNPVFVVASDDAVATHQRAVEHGSRIFCEPREWSTRGANGMMKNFIGISFFDPDGYFFECNQLVSETEIDESTDSA